MWHQSWMHTITCISHCPGSPAFWPAVPCSTSKLNSRSRWRGEGSLHGGTHQKPAKHTLGSLELSQVHPASNLGQAWQAFQSATLYHSFNPTNACATMQQVSVQQASSTKMQHSACATTLEARYMTFWLIQECVIFNDVDWTQGSQMQDNNGSATNRSILLKSTTPASSMLTRD